MSGVKSGDWAKLERLLSQASSKLKQNLSEATKEAGHLIETTAVGHIEKQDLPWPPLTEKYALRKMLKGARKLKRMSPAKLTARLSRQGIAYGANEDKGTLALRLASGGNQILVETGRIMAGIRYRQQDWKGGVVTAKRMSDDGRVNLSGVHEMGAPSRSIPARPFMKPTSEEVGPKVAKLYEEAVEKTFRS